MSTAVRRPAAEPVERPLASSAGGAGQGAKAGGKAGARTDAASRGPSGFRADIEGLRAVAVTLVVLNHALLWPSGGFLGVDVFFVISGFLITGLLLRDWRRDGTVSFAGFYARRVRRILPAAVLVIVVTVAAGFLLLSQPRAESVGADGLWSLLFAENWHLIAGSADYFQSGAAVSPLQHYWSLAVEEQFYLLWPLLLLLLLAVPLRRGRASGSAAVRRAAIVFTAVCAVSFAWSAASAFAAPGFAYFDTLGRVWELGLGALLATLATTWQRLPGILRPLLAWAGIALLLAAAWLTTSDMPLPAPGGLAAVAGAGLLIVAGTGGRPGWWLWPLTNPVTRYIGRISFSLYLWHFPVIIYLGVLFGADNPLLPALSITLSVVLAVASFHLVEEPFRRMAWPRPRTAETAPSPVAAARLNRRKLANGALTVGAVAAAALVVVALVRVAPREAAAAVPLQTAVPSAPAAGPGSGGGAAPVDAAKERTEALQSALRETSWPKLTPAVASFGQNGRAVIAPEWGADGCLGLDDARVADPEENADRCLYGNADADAAHTAVVFGDSVAISYVPMIRAALGSDWAVHVYTLAACPASDAPVTKVGGGDYPQCPAFRTWAIERISKLAPALVFVSEATDNSRLESRAEGDAAFAEWTGATRTTLQRLKGAASEVVVITRPPAGRSLYDCQSAVSSPTDCVSEVERGFERRAVALRDVVDESGDGYAFVNTLSWFCSQGQCPAFIGTTPVFADGIHLTGAASAAAAPLLAQKLAPLISRAAGRGTQPAS